MSSVKSRPTIKNVAEKAGVSLSTVSGVLNGVDEFSEQTKKKVWDAAFSLNYVPNIQARQLRACNGMEAVKRRKTGIIMHITHVGNQNVLGDIFEARRSQIVSWESAVNGLYAVSYWYHRLKGFQCPPVLDGLIDGAIVGTPHQNVVDTLHGKLPIVLMDVPPGVGADDIPTVNMDIRHGVMLLLRHLRERGHFRIGMMYSNYVFDSLCSLEIPIIDVFREAALSCGIEIPTSATISEKICSENHNEAMEKIAMNYLPLIRNKEITAIICPKTVYAETLFSSFVKMNLKIPEDISIIGGVHFDFGIPQFDICSMLYNWPQLVKTSLKTLKELIDGKESACINYIIKPEVHYGKTVGEITKGGKPCEREVHARFGR